MNARINKKGFTIFIAGFGISFSFNQRLSELPLDMMQNAFLKDMDEDIELQVHHGHIPEMRAKEKIFDSGETWAIYESAGKYVLQNDTLKSDSSPDTFIVLEPNLRSGEVFVPNDHFNKDLFPDPLGYPLNQVLMIMLLSLGKGMLFHACGIDDNGSGYLFLGNSTDGKSTMAKLWFENRSTVLNDDRIVVREKDGGFWMYGTPWHGDFRALSPTGLPIEKVFFLRHGDRNGAVVKKGVEAVAMLLVRSFPPLWDDQGMAYSTDLCHRLISEIPCYELSFAPDAGILDFVRNV